jgi:FKBP-type peptidyl-prolyl cis-trans isomerase FkpA
MKKYLFLALLAAVCGVAGCKKDKIDEVAIDAKNIEDIRAYLKTKSIQADSTSSGLYYVIEKEGTLDHPTATSVVTVKYTGYYLDGSSFDSSNGNSVTFSLQSVIAGWTEGIPKFKRGGKGKLFIPAKLGYGYTDHSAIPGGSVLIFDIELIDF